MYKKEELLKIVRNAKTKKEIKDWLGLTNNGRDTKKMINICLENDISFKNEFSVNVKKNENCLECGKQIPLKRKFCTSSCSVTFNNKKRVLSDETKNKISKTFKLKYENGYTHPNIGKGVIKSENYDILSKKYKYNCVICDKEYGLKVSKSGARKTCSRECQTKLIFKDRSYHNGSRKTYKYFNEFIGEEVILESSWELKVAELLDSKNIFWERPKSLDWVDENGITRQYYSDFYLKDYELYLDPKNPYCMKLDKVKMEYIRERYKVKYGSLKYIINEVNKINGD